MKKISVIVCNNGQGHLKRVLFLIEALFKRYNLKINTDIFVSLEKLKYFSSAVANLKSANRRVNFFNITSEKEIDYEKEFLSKFRDLLEKSDSIWSDNLTFPLKYQERFFLTGSFLWLDVQKDEYAAQEEKLLKYKQPVMIGNKYFAMPRVKSLTNFTGVGMYEYFPFCMSNKLASGILLSCGKSKTAALYFKKYIGRLRKEIKKIPLEITIFIQPEYYESFSSLKNVKMATFSNTMFVSLYAACIRPGLGTVNDVLLRGAKIFSFFEEDNVELKYNAQVLKTLNLGEISKSPQVALSSAVGYLSDKDEQQKIQASLKNLDFNGLEETIYKIKGILN